MRKTPRRVNLIPCPFSTIRYSNPCLMRDAFAARVASVRTQSACEMLRKRAAQSAYAMLMLNAPFYAQARWRLFSPLLLFFAERD